MSEGSSACVFMNWLHTVRKRVWLRFSCLALLGSLWSAGKSQESLESLRCLAAGRGPGSRAPGKREGALGVGLDACQSCTFPQCLARFLVSAPDFTWVPPFALDKAPWGVRSPALQIGRSDQLAINCIWFGLFSVQGVGGSRFLAPERDGCVLLRACTAGPFVFLSASQPPLPRLGRQPAPFRIVTPQLWIDFVCRLPCLCRAVWRICPCLPAAVQSAATARGGAGEKCSCCSPKGKRRAAVFRTDALSQGLF